MTWQLQESKNKFSEVVGSGILKGPQIICRRGRNAAIVISYEEYKKLTSKKKTVKEALMAIDISHLNLSRDKSATGRATPL